MLRTPDRLTGVSMADIVGVPYYSQKEVQTSQKYGGKACGLTSLRMVLGYYGHPLGFADVDRIAAQVGAYDEEKGWIHSGLVNIARDLGLNGFRINYTMLEDENIAQAGPVLAREGATVAEVDEFTKSVLKAREKGRLAAIDDLIDKGVPVIASMAEKYAGTTASHLVVVKGYVDGKYIINDPWDFGQNYAIPKEEFDALWTKRAVVVYNLAA